jgi:hypothetical protein
VVGLEEGGESLAGSEAETLVPGAVQHVHQIGYPSTGRVKQNKVVDKSSSKRKKKSVDVNEKPHRQKGRILSTDNPKPSMGRACNPPFIF